jgi:hypothetical protein
MKRQKKIKSLQVEKKEEVVMTDTPKIEPVLEQVNEAQAIIDDIQRMKDEIESTKQEIAMAKMQSEELEQNDIRVELAALKRELQELKRSKSEFQVMPKRELDADESFVYNKHVILSESRKGLKEKIERDRIRDSEMVRGKFINRRAPGKKSQALTYLRYDTDPVKWYYFNDGGFYTIPRGFMDEINEYYHTPVFVQKQGPMDPDNPESQIAEVNRDNKKYAFFEMAG